MIKTVLLFAAGAFCLIRGMHNSVRALVSNGAIRRCEGSNSFGVCDPSVEIVTKVGEAVFATASGSIIAIGKDFVHVQVDNEPVILMYQGLTPATVLGQFVSVGQPLGKCEGILNFSVTQMGPGGLRVIAPSAWLASRGCKVIEHLTSTSWCGQGRNIIIPGSDQRICDFSLPDKAGFALLPVSIETQ